MHRALALLIDSFQIVAPCISPSCSLCVSANAVLEDCDISAAIATVFHQFAAEPTSKLVGDNAIDTDMLSNQLTLDLRNLRSTCPTLWSVFTASTDKAEGIRMDTNWLGTNPALISQHSFLVKPIV